MHGALLALLLLVIACDRQHTDARETEPTGHTDTDFEGVDLSERLGAGEVRAGIVSDEAALFGGISAEGQVGDLKLYNDRVQFIVQGDRVGHFRVQEPGMVVDADIVRPEGHLGRDMVDEWVPMFGVGRIPMAEQIEVVEDGSEGRAVVRVSGAEVAMPYVTGALEDPEVVRDLHLELTTDYILEPDSWLLEVRTEVEATDLEATVTPGDVLFGASEVADLWQPGVGTAFDPPEESSWLAYVGREADGAVGVFAPTTLGSDEPDLVLKELGQAGMAMGAAVTLQPGASFTWSRWYGVGPDLATLTDAWLEATDQPTEEVSGVVTAPDGPVAGARVVVRTDGLPFTLAFTDEHGAFAARVPAGALAEVMADGRGHGRFTDLPEGRTAHSAYAAAAVRGEVLAGLRDGAEGPPCARGRGTGTLEEPLALGQPARLVVRTGDGLPFEVQARRVEIDPVVDLHVILPRPDGLHAWGWARDGEVVLEVEPGTYNLLVHRGPVYEMTEVMDVVLAAGDEEVVEVGLERAFEHPGWMLADPHMHASPSPDGRITMEDRLVVAAARGVQLHFGSDHDHSVDYRPLLEPLGLGDVLASVVADEVSPNTRGHLNAYPLDPDPTRPNHGAYGWYANIVDSTEAQMASLREWWSDDVIIQVNHPARGLAEAAGWSPGVIGTSSKWTEDFQAVEVLNGGNYAEHLPFFEDLTSHGLLVTPTGSSDSHDHARGNVGLSSTWAHVGTDDVAEYTDEAMVDAWSRRAVVVSRGPLVLTDPLPGSEVVGAVELEVEVRSASWVRVDRIELIRDGLRVQEVPGTRATFHLEPEVDAWYSVIAVGSQGMHPVTGATPWAMTSPILVDVDGDGWDPPSGQLLIAE